MLRIALHALIACVATLFLVICGLVVGLFIRLQMGPLDLAPVQHLIASGIQAELPPQWQVSWDHSELAWDGATKNIVVHLQNQKILDEQAQPVLQIKEARLTAHLLHLLAGHWVPRDVWLTGLHLNLNLDPALLRADNPQPKDKTQQKPLKLDEILQMVWRDVHSVHVNDADLLITMGDAPPLALRELNVEALRQHQQVQMVLTAKRQVYTTQDSNDFTLRYDYDLQHKLSKANLGITNIYFADVMAYLKDVPALTELAKIDWQVPLNIRLAGKETGQEKTRNWQWDFKVKLASGFIAVPEQLPYAIAVEACELDGQLLPVVKVAVQNCQLHMPHGPMNTTLQAQQQGERWLVKTAIAQANVEDLDYFWPPSIAPGGYRWLKANMQQGLVDQIKIDLVYDPAVPSEIASMAGGFQMHNVTTKFLKPLAPITNANGFAVLKDDALTFTIERGQYLDQTIGATKLYMTKLFADLPILEIDTELSGPLATLLQGVNHAPYYLINYPWLPDHTFSRMQGNYTGKLNMKLPMLADLQMKDLVYDASGSVENITWDKFYKDLPLRAPQADFHLTPEIFSIKGEVGVGELLAKVDWQQQKGKAPSQQGTAKGQTNGQQLADLGLPVENYLTGNFPWQANLQQQGNGPMRLNLQADLTPVAIQFSANNIIKTSGQNGRLALQAVINDHNTQLQNIQLTSPQINVRGNVQLSENGALQNLNLNPLRLGAHTDARVQGNNQQWQIRGNSLDLTPLMQQQSPAQANEKTDNLHPAQQLDLQTGQLWFGADLPIDQPHILLARRQNQAWHQIDITGTVGKEAAPLNLHWQPDQNGQKLNANIANLGLALRAFGLTDKVVDGQLTATGTGQAGTELQADTDITLTNFKIRNMPLLARIISATSPSGLLNLLNGSGLGFDELQTKVKYRADQIALQVGKMHSAALGLTFGGLINSANNALDIKGTVVPFYALNHLISQIPLLGDILAGADDAVVGASYHATGKLDDPDVSINPLSALTPGFIRDLFFASSEDEPTQPEK